MVKLKFLFFLPCLLLAILCSGQPVMDYEYIERLEDTRHSKKLRYKFKVDSSSQKDSSLFKSRLYLIEIGRPSGSEFDKKFDTTFTFLRFFSDGRVFYSERYYSIPTISQYNDLTYGRRGYYTYDDSVLVMEFFINPYDGYWNYYAEISEDILKLIEKKPRWGAWATQRKLFVVPDSIGIKVDYEPTSDIDW